MTYSFQNSDVVLSRNLDRLLVGPHSRKVLLQPKILEVLLERIWTISIMHDDQTLYSPDELAAVYQFENTHCRYPNGSYKVSLPRKNPPQQFGESRSTALKWFLSIERQLSHKGKLGNYNKTMREYLSLNNVEAVPLAELDKVPVHMM